MIYGTSGIVYSVRRAVDGRLRGVCKGLSVTKMEPKHALLCGAYFGGFQALMPAIGYLLGSQFESMITQIDHWIAFVLLGIIGSSMIKESREDEEEEVSASFDVKTMLALAVATSIDALAVGVTFAFLHVNIVWAVTFIGCTTFVLSAIGVKVGNVFGMKYKSRAELAGGVILILMGIKILLEHLGFLG